ncbi:MAG TPA: antitoxin [bacterium]|jgi:predicted DNA binding CopG/RHH family protein|nr:antitoxin [bacterium]
MKQKLSQDELEILNAYESGNAKRIKNFEAEKKRYQSYARETMKKNKRVNIRMSEYDLKAIQLKAMEEGMPYQTFIASVLHKVADGKIKIHS